MSFLVSGKPVLTVLAGDKKTIIINIKKTFHEKTKMIQFELLNEYIGHEAGSICPFGINDDVLVYLDISLKEHDFVCPACGSSNSAIMLTISELEKYANYKDWIDFSK